MRLSYVPFRSRGTRSVTAPMPLTVNVRER